MDIYVYGRDHNPPHFHVRMNNQPICSITIRTGEVLEGELARNLLQDAQDWCNHNREALMTAWENIRAGLHPDQIPPLG